MGNGNLRLIAIREIDAAAAAGARHRPTVLGKAAPVRVGHCGVHRSVVQRTGPFAATRSHGESIAGLAEMWVALCGIIMLDDVEMHTWRVEGH